MHLKRAVDTPKGLKQVGRQESPLGQHSVQARRTVALGQDEPVPVRPVWTLWVYAHDVEVQRRENVGLRQGASWMPCSGLRDRPHDVAPDSPGGFLKPMDFLS